MYLPNLFNNIGVFQYFGGFLEKYSDKRKVQINEFLLHATSLIISLYRIKYLSDICVVQFGKQKNNLAVNNDSRILFTSTQMVEMMGLMPSCFASLCVMQDKIFSMFDEVLGIKSPPLSFHDVHRKIEKLGLKGEVVKLTNSYWKNIGKQTRDYRDIGQHFYNLVSHSYYQLSPEEKPVVLLPDNPDDKSYHKFTYLQQYDCFPFLNKAFNQLHDYIEKLLEINGFNKKNIQFSFNMEPAKELTMGQKETLLLAYYDEKAEQGIEIGHVGDGRIYLRSIGDWANKK